MIIANIVGIRIHSATGLTMLVLACLYRRCFLSINYSCCDCLCCVGLRWGVDPLSMDGFMLAYAVQAGLN